jgi:tetratricopeptide (TPR) repeat protein
VLWSAVYSAPPSDPGLLRERAASTASAVIRCATQTSNDLVQSPDNALRAIFAACERFDDDADSDTVAAWRRVVATEPDNATAIATLSFVEASWAVNAGETGAVDGRQIAALRAAARQHIQKARSVDRHLGLAYAAEATLIPFKRYGERMATIQRGLAENPTCAPLYALMAALLADVGRLDDAIRNARLAVSKAPNSATFRSELISTLAYSGYLGDAQSELRAAERLWPDSPTIREVRPRIDYRYGDPAALIRKIDRGVEMPYTSRDFATGVTRAFLLARATPIPANVEAAAKLAVRFNGTPVTLQNLVGLGRVDQAYRVMADPQRFTTLQGNGVEILFRVNMRAFRLDRRFMALANRLGLVRYWQSSNAWPDFCGEKDLPYNCKAEARRLLR